MSQIIVLDSGVIGLISNPRGSHQSFACSEWLESLLLSGDVVVVPEIADYEIRRELIRASKQSGIQKLDALEADLVYLPLSTPSMRQAARLWASARKQGRPTATDDSLDVDVILAAQAQEIANELGLSVVVATTNVAHLSLFVHARRWEEIQPGQPPI